MILYEGRVLREDWALLRLFNIALQRDQPLPASFVEQIVDSLYRLQVKLFAEFRSTENSSEPGCNLFQNVERVGNQHGSGRGPANNKEFCRLNEHLDIAVLHQIAAHDGAKNYDDSNNRKHDRSAR